MRFKEGATEWGINFRRMVRWRNEVSFLSAVPLAWGRRGLSKVSSTGPLVGIEPPVRMRNLDIKPYALGSTTTNNRAIPPIDNDGDANFGVDAKWGITQSVVADFTYNTDFAQVEDDEAQVNLTRFSVLFPEKRDFFLEGQDVFNFAGAGSNQGGGGIPSATQSNPTNNTPIVFFSRRIGLQNGQVMPILAGARMLGRGNGFQVGAVHMHTEEVDARLAPATDFSVVRVNRTSSAQPHRRHRHAARARAPGGEENYAYGVDAAINPLNNLAINSYWSGTEDVNSTAAGANDDAQQLPRAAQLERRSHRVPGRAPVRGRRVSTPRWASSAARVPPQLWVGALQPAADELEGRAEGLLRGQRTTTSRSPSGHPESREVQGAYPHGNDERRPVGVRVHQPVRVDLVVPFQVTPGVVVPAGRLRVPARGGCCSRARPSGPSRARSR